MKFQSIILSLLSTTVAATSLNDLQTPYTPPGEGGGLNDLQFVPGVNFAFGGAQTNDKNRATNCLANPDTCGPLQAALDASNLVLPGLSQQIDYAAAPVTDDHKNKDLYLLYAAGNDFLGPYPGWGPNSPAPAYGAPLPPDFNSFFLQFTARWSVTNIKANLEKLDSTLDAKYIVMGNWLEPCSTPACGFLNIPGLFEYSAEWVVQFDSGIRQAIAEFEAENPEAVIIFVDVYSKIKELLASGEFRTDGFCLLGLIQGDPTVTGPDSNSYYSCGTYAWTDATHPTTELWTRIVDEAFLPAIKASIPNGIEKNNLSRLITFGDSYTDLGSFKDVADGAGFGASFNPPPSNGPATQNGKSLVTLIEEGLGLETSTAYLLP